MSDETSISNKSKKRAASKRVEDEEEPEEQENITENGEENGQEEDKSKKSSKRASNAEEYDSDEDKPERIPQVRGHHARTAIGRSKYHMQKGVDKILAKNAEAYLKDIVVAATEEADRASDGKAKRISPLHIVRASQVVPMVLKHEFVAEVHVEKRRGNKKKKKAAQKEPGTAATTSV